MAYKPVYIMFRIGPGDGHGGTPRVTFHSGQIAEGHPAILCHLGRMVCHGDTELAGLAGSCGYCFHTGGFQPAEMTCPPGISAIFANRDSIPVAQIKPVFVQTVYGKLRNRPARCCCTRSPVEAVHIFRKPAQIFIPVLPEKLPFFPAVPGMIYRNGRNILHMRPHIRGSIPPLRVVGILNHRAVALFTGQQSCPGRYPGPPAVPAAADAAPDAGGHQMLRVTAVKAQLGKARAFIQQLPGFSQIRAGIEPPLPASGLILEQTQHPAFARLHIVHVQVIIANGACEQYTRNSRVKSDAAESFLRQQRLLPGLAFIAANPQTAGITPGSHDIRMMRIDPNDLTVHPGRPVSVESHTGADFLPASAAIG